MAEAYSEHLYVVQNPPSKPLTQAEMDRTYSLSLIHIFHAGLECGLFLNKRPELDCVSIGSALRDVHSFKESLDIASAERVWDLSLIHI